MRRLLGLGVVAILSALPACGGSTDSGGSGGSAGAGAVGGSAGSGAGGTGGGMGGSGGATGGTGGCTFCGPDGAPCCSPGMGCAGTNGGQSCTCTAAGVWSCSSGSGGSGGGSGGTGSCNDTTDCELGITCCNRRCVNTANDINNCGSCNNTCAGPYPFCNGTSCGQPPCDLNPPPGGACCGMQVCQTGELCCEVNRGPSFLGCEAPVNGTCPQGCPSCVCASPDTPIATPGGQQPIASLREGDRVYSLHQGKLVAVPIKRAQRVTAHAHHVVQLELASGVTLRISAPHPTADGRTFGDLRVGNLLDGVSIRRVQLVPYTHDATYDILPDSDSGTYFAGGVLIGSTLAPPLRESLGSLR